MKFYLKDKSIFKNMVEYINQMRSEGKTPVVTISEKDSRSARQNRLMRKWFADIAKQSGNSIDYEAGRCKYKYFLPFLVASDDKQAQFNSDLLRLAYQRGGYEYVCKILGNGAIASTSLLTVEEFSKAMKEMYFKEHEYRLTDPSLEGLDQSF